MSWLPAADRGFGVWTLPYGSFTVDGSDARHLGVAVAEHVLELGRAAEQLAPDLAPLCDTATLDPLLAAGPPAWRRLRDAVSSWLRDDDARPVVEPLLVPQSDVALHVPFTVADYVDFYSSEYHAANVGRIFRPGSDPLPPAWKCQPLGYHGRAGTVVVSGTDVVRPHGQRRDAGGVTFGPSQRLDVEVEVGFVVGVPSRLGHSVAVEDFRRHVFGLCLLNDWSARDVQAFETVPLGPFLGKSFATSVSPWVVPLAALEAAKVPAPQQEPSPAEYLLPAWSGYDLSLELRINGVVVSRPRFAEMYWTPAQQLAHLTVNGASLRTGDLFGSGTVSGPEPDRRGCLLELTWGGSQPVPLDGDERIWLHDGDTVVIAATAPGPGGEVLRLGEVRGTVRPARRQLQ